MYSRKYYSLVIIFSMFLSAGVYGSPVTYKVDGYLSGLYGDGPSVVALDLNFMDPISYEFIIDIEKSGYSLESDGSKTTHENTSSASDTEEYFYAELLEISYVVNDTYYNWGRENYYAANIDSFAYSSLVGRVMVGPELLYLDTSSYISEWQVGDSFRGAHWWHDSVNGEFITLHSSLTLTEVSEVPIVSSLLLFVSSLFFLWFPINLKAHNK